jgi:hypothetical protein
LDLKSSQGSVPQEGGDPSQPPIFTIFSTTGG